MKLSILLPTYNNERTIEECLKSISEQDFPKKEYEVLLIDGGSTDRTLEIAKKYPVKIINNPKRVEEAARIMGLKKAKGKIIGLIDADNILVGNDWLSKMLSPFKDKDIIFADTLYYGYRESDFMKVRYQGLIGGDDPLANYLGLYSRWSYFQDNWTGFPFESENKGDYIKASFKNMGLIPAMGSNGFLVRKNILRKFVNDSFIHSDIIYEMVNKGYNCFAKVNAHIIHDQPSFFKNKVRRINRRIRSEVAIKYNYGITKKKLFFVFLRSILIFPVLYDMAKGYFSRPDSAWLFHIPAVYGLIGMHLYFNILSILKLEKREI